MASIAFERPVQCDISAASSRRVAVWNPRNMTFIAFWISATNFGYVAEGRLVMALGSEHNNTFGSGVDSLVLNEPPEVG